MCFVFAPAAGARWRLTWQNYLAMAKVTSTGRLFTAQIAVNQNWGDTKKWGLAYEYQ